jgi:pyruvate formate lyase activating enzyme
MTSGMILHVQKMSTEDGPGIRSTVFFKGCGLHCAWCHNPESISFKPEIQWFASRCLYCQTCASICSHNNLTFDETGLHIDRENCRGCFDCAVACPANAIEPLGHEVSVEELLEELLKDRAYYEKSGGGVTLSGGEPTLQPEFSEALLRELQAHGIQTALDTCGVCSQANLERLLPHANLVLYDLKLLDEAQHLQHTLVSNRQILENIRYLAGYLHRTPNPPVLWIRTPLIPQATSTQENISGIGRFIRDELDGLVARWELCAINNLCREQYKRLGLTWQYADEPLMSADELAHWEAVAKASGVNPEIVLASGATRIEGSI